MPSTLDDKALLAIAYKHGTLLEENLIIGLRAVRDASLKGAASVCDGRVNGRQFAETIRALIPPGET